MDRILGVILAGGLARRMGGGDKPLRLLGGRPMLSHVVERFAPQVDALVINANGDPARFSEYGLPIVPDPVGDNPGPLAGLLAGLLHARAIDPQMTHVATAAGDTPFLPHDLVAKLSTALVGTSSPTIAIPRSSSGTHQVFGLFPVEITDELALGLHDGSARKVMAWVERHPNVIVDFGDDHDIDPFFNANSPDDLKKGEEYLRNAQHK